MHTLILVAKRATARPIPFNRQDRMNRHTIRYALILIAALAVAALAVARFDGLCSIFSTVWSALEPLAIGAVLAYLLNFIAFIFTEQSMVYKNAGKLFSNGF